jgi:hypothetical protein
MGSLMGNSGGGRRRPGPRRAGCAPESRSCRRTWPGSSTAVPYASRVSRWMASRPKLVSSSSNSSSVIGVTALLPEELKHPVWDLNGGLPAGNVHLGEHFRAGDVPALHGQPASRAGAVTRGPQAGHHPSRLRRRRVRGRRPATARPSRRRESRVLAQPGSRPSRHPHRLAAAPEKRPVRHWHGRVRRPPRTRILALLPLAAGPAARAAPRPHPRRRDRNRHPSPGRAPADRGSGGLASRDRGGLHSRPPVLCRSDPADPARYRPERVLLRRASAPGARPAGGGSR